MDLRPVQFHRRHDCSPSPAIIAPRRPRAQRPLPYNPRRMAKPRSDLIDRLQYVGVRVVSMMMQCWPVNTNLCWAKLLGDALYRVDKKHRDRALANLRRSFPELSEKQRETLARRSMQELFMFFVEMLFTPRLIHIDTWARYITL